MGNHISKIPICIKESQSKEGRCEASSEESIGMSEDLPMLWKSQPFDKKGEASLYSFLVEMIQIVMT